MDKRDPEILLGLLEARHAAIQQAVDRAKEQLVLLENLLIEQMGDIRYLKHRIENQETASLGRLVMERVGGPRL